MMTKSEALQAIKDSLEESLDYFSYFDTSGDEMSMLICIGISKI